MDNETDARQIARDWNVKASGSRFVVRFESDEVFRRRYPIRQAGGNVHLEYRIPAAELATFDEHIAGPIVPVASYPEPEA